MLTLIITARNRAYTKELVEIAIRYLRSSLKVALSVWGIE